MAILEALALTKIIDTGTHRVYAPEQEEDGKPVARIAIYEPAGRLP